MKNRYLKTKFSSYVCRVKLSCNSLANKNSNVIVLYWLPHQLPHLFNPRYCGVEFGLVVGLFVFFFLDDFWFGVGDEAFVAEFFADHVQFFLPLGQLFVEAFQFFLDIEQISQWQEDFGSGDKG